MKVGRETRIWSEEKSVLLECDIGSNCVIHAPVWIGNKVVIGDRVKIQAFVFIPDGVYIGSDSFIGPHVVFTNDKYPPSGGKGWAMTIVEPGVVIGANATILPGITIGRKAVIGAGAVVTRSVPPGTTWVGNPARQIKP